MATDPFSVGGIFEIGNSWIVLGPKRSAKSTLCIIFAQAAVKHGWIVATNIVFVRWSTDHSRWVHAQPENTFQVESWAEYAALLPMALRTNKKILLIADEMGASDLAGGTTSLQSNVRAALAATSQLGKWRTTQLYAVQSLRLINAALRTSGELITGHILKRSYAGFNRREIAIFRTPDYETDASGNTMLESVRRVSPSGWARPKSELEIRDPNGKVIGYKPDQIVFESEAPASWGLGFFPGTAKPFDLAGMIKATSGKLIQDQAAIIENFLVHAPSRITRYDPRIEQALEATDEDEPDDDEEDEGEGTPKTLDAIRRLWDFFDNGGTPANANREVGVARSWAYREYAKWEKGDRPPSLRDEGDGPQDAEGDAPIPSNGARRKRRRRPASPRDSDGRWATVTPEEKAGETGE